MIAPDTRLGSTELIPFFGLNFLKNLFLKVTENKNQTHAVY